MFEKELRKALECGPEHKTHADAEACFENQIKRAVQAHQAAVREARRGLASAALEAAEKEDDEAAFELLQFVALDKEGKE